MCPCGEIKTALSPAKRSSYNLVWNYLLNTVYHEVYFQFFHRLFHFYSIGNQSIFIMPNTTANILILVTDFAFIHFALNSSTECNYPTKIYQLGELNKNSTVFQNKKHKLTICYLRFYLNIKISSRTIIVWRHMLCISLNVDLIVIFFDRILL